MLAYPAPVSLKKAISKAGDFFMRINGRRQLSVAWHVHYNNLKKMGWKLSL